MCAVEIDDLEPPVFFRFRAFDRDGNPLAVGRPACRGLPVSGREDATAILAVDSDESICPADPSAVSGPSL